jgi:hypothetical protein
VASGVCRSEERVGSLSAWTRPCSSWGVSSVGGVEGHWGPAGEGDESKVQATLGLYGVQSFLGMIS